MDDSQVMGRIDELVAEEQRLFEREGRGDLEPGDHARLDEIKVSLDRCGICFASAARSGSSASTRMTPRREAPTPWSTTGSE